MPVYFCGDQKYLDTAQSKNCVGSALPRSVLNASPLSLVVVEHSVLPLEMRCQRATSEDMVHCGAHDWLRVALYPRGIHVGLSSGRNWESVRCLFCGDARGYTVQSVFEYRSSLCNSYSGDGGDRATHVAIFTWITCIYL